MQPLTKARIESLPIQARSGARFSSRFVEEEGQANPTVLFILPFLILGLGFVVGGFAEGDLSMGAIGAAILGVIFGGIATLEKISLHYFRARWEAVEEYLVRQDPQALISQATGLGPDYLGRECLFNYLDETLPGWASHHIDRLGRLAVSPEISRTQQNLIKGHLNKNFPGWSVTPSVA